MERAIRDLILGGEGKGEDVLLVEDYGILTTVDFQKKGGGGKEKGGEKGKKRGRVKGETGMGIQWVFVDQ